MRSEYPQKKLNWPNITYRFNSGVFVEKNKDFFNITVVEPFNPEQMSEQIINKLLPEIHDLKKEEFIPPFFVPYFLP